MFTPIDPHLHQPQVYLDANATTAVLPEIADIVSHTMQVCFGNPSSSHITGIKAKHLMEETRQLAKQVIGAQTGHILFTSGATEGIQTAIVSALLAIKEHDIAEPILMYGATEHKAVPNTLAHWNSVLGINATMMAISVDQDGLLDHDFIAEHVGQALMICTMAVNNETGVCQDLALLEQVIRANNPSVAWMVDCVQALGKLDLAISETTIDYAPFSGHKLYAPKGIGFLYIREQSPYTPFIAGGGQEGGMRSGTENLPGIAGLNRLFSLLIDPQQSVFKSHQQLHSYREQLEKALRSVFPKIVFNHRFDLSVPTTLNFAVKNISSKEIMDLFDAAGIRVSAGSACSSGASRSYVLDAMSVDNWQSENAIRLSFGPAATQVEIDEACKRITQLKSVLASACLVISDSQVTEQEVCALGLSQYKHQGACCWLFVTDEKEAVIIDPIIELLPRLMNVIQGQKLTLKAMLATHQHAHDEPLASYYSLAGLTQPDNLDLLGWPNQIDDIQIGRYQLMRISTPGHNENSVSYLLMDQDKVVICFCGDLILPGGLGRTNLDDSDPAQMYDSLLSLSQRLSSDSVLCSSHDYAQSFAIDWHSQQAINPLLNHVVTQQIDKQEFIKQKQASDQSLAAQVEYFCGAVVSPASHSLVEKSLPAALSLIAEEGAILLDIRESYEHSASQLATLLNINEQHVRNVPLNRISDAIWQKRLDPKQSYVLICRSGNRSRQACLNLQQLGFEQVYNIRGGLALL
ncbi:hypothetical protein PULV_a3005 [Pseudoalteromonas ulvae UL12]|uniref:aminotransferase class V-fold PLP-dependent enzyme n=1 Tax=Pseudoalteromonas ulvae TaxID=107327 RepID=UPI00186BB2BF|nr:aminotransferase class V-fold PLP-dependent enzyme [Pseudoalteromonas ulvae]MBE0362383.1 hypothetical protein [Pseudoalteromonas ulvae UL12]